MWLSLILAMCWPTDASDSPHGPAPATITAWDCDNPSRTHVYERDSFCTPDSGDKPSSPHWWSQGHAAPLTTVNVLLPSKSRYIRPAASDAPSDDRQDLTSAAYGRTKRRSPA